MGRVFSWARLKEHWPAGTVKRRRGGLERGENFGDAVARTFHLSGADLPATFGQRRSRGIPWVVPGNVRFNGGVR